jgi:signal transduction histidine kinase
MFETRGFFMWRCAITAMSDTQEPLQLPVLAAGLVHEVKNPLSAIHLHLQLLENQVLQVEDEELRNQMKRRVEIIKREVLGLNQTLQDFIRLIRSETRVIPAKGLNEIVEEVVHLLTPQAARHQIRIETVTAAVPDHLKVDGSFLKQVLVNLILNSIQAYETIDDNRDRLIVVTTGTENGRFFLRVEDNGAGIQPEDRERIFEPFFTTKAQGSGLGLALVRKMMMEMGGRVDLVSSPGKGTSFTLYFDSEVKSLPEPDVESRSSDDL